MSFQRLKVFLKWRPPHKFPKYKTRGNALFLILIAVALFAALSYAVTNSGRGGGDTNKEKALLDAGLAQQCIANVERAVNTLQLVFKCTADQISYELPDGTNENPANPSNKECFVFDTLGMGVTPCGSYLLAACSAAELLALAVGQKCADGDIVYAGTSGGNRIYTTLVDQGSTTWNDGGSNANFMVMTPATSTSDGLANTDALIGLTDDGAPYAAALLCRGLGAKWYLPAVDELALLNSVAGTGVLNGTFDMSGTEYWSSTQNTGNEYHAHIRVFRDDAPFSTGSKNSSRPVRCVRRD